MSESIDQGGSARAEDAPDIRNGLAVFAIGSAIRRRQFRFLFAQRHLPDSITPPPTTRGVLAIQTSAKQELGRGASRAIGERVALVAKHYDE